MVDASCVILLCLKTFTSHQDCLVIISDCLSSEIKHSSPGDNRFCLEIFAERVLEDFWTAVFAL